MCSSFRRSGGTGAGACIEEILGLLVHREGDDLADVRLAGQQHHDRSMPGAEPPWGGAPYLKAFSIPPNRASTSSWP